MNLRKHDKAKHRGDRRPARHAKNQPWPIQAPTPDDGQTLWPDSWLTADEAKAARNNG